MYRNLSVILYSPGALGSYSELFLFQYRTVHAYIIAHVGAFLHHEIIAK